MNSLKLVNMFSRYAEWGHIDEEDWGEVTHFVVFTTEPVITGDILCYGLLQATLDIALGSVPEFAIDDIVISLD